VKEGILTKCGGRVKNWKERYCILLVDEFQYYKKKGDKKPAGVIKLDINTMIRQEDDKTTRGFVFSIRPSERVKEKDADRTYLIAAATEEERQTWVSLIDAQIKTARSPWEVLNQSQIRAGSGPECEMIGSLEKGEVVQVTEVQGNWARHNKGWSIIKELDGKTNLKEMVVVRKGFLLKEGGKFTKTWHNYFFILYTHKFQYYRNVKEKASKTITLTREGMVEIRTGGKAHVFTFVPKKGDKGLVLAAASKEERNAWMANLKRVISELV